MGELRDLLQEGLDVVQRAKAYEAGERGVLVPDLGISEGLPDGDGDFGLMICVDEVGGIILL